MREWGRANGMKVSDRGRISRQVREAFAAAHR
ncbi:MAG: Lsr2 family DNA-binding protein [Acidimicrobiales bacterium]